MNYMWIGILAARSPRWLPFPGGRAQRRAIRTVQDVVHDLIARRPASGTPGRSDLVDALAATTQCHRALLRDEAVSLLLGAEPLGITVAWALHLLAQNRRAQEIATVEVDTVLSGRMPRFDDVAAMPYTRMVLKEALRLCPPTYWVQRRAQNDDVIGGLPVPAGTIVVIMLRQIHLNPDAWSDPERFEPERFESARLASRHRQAWMPFGAGRRICIAQEFSMLQGQLIVALLLQRYRLSPHPNRTPELTAGVNLRPRDGIWLALEPRNPTGSIAHAR